MTEEELLALAEKVKNDTATDDEKILFYKEFEKLTKEVGDEIDIHNLRSQLLEE